MTFEYTKEETESITTQFFEIKKQSPCTNAINWKIDSLRLETFLFLNELDTLLNELN